jgi:uncharacterized cupredoxin-like copper-binding protein
MTSVVRRRKWGALSAGAGVLVLAATSTMAVAATSGAFAEHQGGNALSQSCAAPAPAGSPATVTLVDMRAMMGRTMTGGGMMSGGGPLMGQNDWPRFRQGMMHVTLAPTSVSHGTVSLRVHNTGYLTHELVVLPLAAGQAAGTRVPGSNGKVTEDGSLGEASASCAAGTGDGITAGSTGWVTLKLPAGRYEIVCNLPGHYAAGMHTEFDVT